MHRRGDRGDGGARVDDMESETRWPNFRPGALEMGVRSMLSFALSTGKGSVGALNVFGLSAHCWDDRDEIHGLLLAANAASAYQLATSREQFNSALASRDMIGQAKGMLMERFSIGRGAGL